MKYLFAIVWIFAFHTTATYCWCLRAIGCAEICKKVSKSERPLLGRLMNYKDCKGYCECNGENGKEVKCTAGKIFTGLICARGKCETNANCSEDLPYFHQSSTFTNRLFTTCKNRVKEVALCYGNGNCVFDPYKEKDCVSTDKI